MFQPNSALMNMGYSGQFGQNGMLNGQTFGPQVMDPMQPVGLQSLGMTNLPGLDKGSSGWFGIDGLGKNLDTLKVGIGGLMTVGDIWNASQQNKLARDSFNHQKGILDTNVANQIKSFNLSLDDKMRSRAIVEGMSDADRDAHIARFSARDERKG